MKQPFISVNNLKSNILNNTVILIRLTQFTENIFLKYQHCANTNFRFKNDYNLNCSERTLTWHVNKWTNCRQINYDCDIIPCVYLVAIFPIFAVKCAVFNYPLFPITHVDPTQSNTSQTCENRVTSDYVKHMYISSIIVPNFFFAIIT